MATLNRIPEVFFDDRTLLSTYVKEGATDLHLSIQGMYLNRIISYRCSNRCRYIELLAFIRVPQVQQDFSLPAIKDGVVSPKSLACYTFHQHIQKYWWLRRWPRFTMQGTHVIPS